MRFASIAGLSGAGAATLAIAIAQALAQSPAHLMGADEIAGTLSGKICTTRTGATFTFTADGHYAYVGLWKSDGHYRVGDGAVTVLLDSGLERTFTISRKDDLLYMERVAISCSPVPGTVARQAVPR